MGCAKASRIPITGEGCGAKVVPGGADELTNGVGQDLCERTLLCSLGLGIGSVAVPFPAEVANPFASFNAPLCRIQTVPSIIGWVKLTCGVASVRWLHLLSSISTASVFRRVSSAEKIARRRGSHRDFARCQL